MPRQKDYQKGKKGARSGETLPSYQDLTTPRAPSQSVVNTPGMPSGGPPSESNILINIIDLLQSKEKLRQKIVLKTDEWEKKIMRSSREGRNCGGH